MVKMAEACRIGRSVAETKISNAQDDSFCMFNVFCVFISLVTILADLTTEILVFAEYCKIGYIYWAIPTFIFIFIPNVIINIFSMRWIVIDQKSSLRHWIAHSFFIGFFERHAKFLQKVFSCKNFESMKSLELKSQRNDLCLLHFLYSFTGTVPQIILQSCAMITLDDISHDTKVFSLIASAASVTWACASYIYSITTIQYEHFQWQSVLLKLIWHFGMLTARISGIILFTLIFGLWTLIPLGLHWFAMTFWIVTQKTTFCPNKLEETFYNFVMGFVYCFSYINLREGHTRYRLLMYYTLMITQNFGSLLVYIIISDIHKQRKIWFVVATVSIVAGTVIGVCGMVLYYRWFHAKGPISWKNIQTDVELNNKIKLPSKSPDEQQAHLKHVRSFKSQKGSEKQINARNANVSNPSPEIENTDKKFLLEHWIARAGSPTFGSVPIGDNSINASSVEIHTVENTPQTLKETPLNHFKTGYKTKKKSSSLQSEIGLKLSSIETLESTIDEITTSNLNLHKRRAICSSDELREDLIGEFDCKSASKINIDESSELSHNADGSNKKTSSDSIDMDLDLSFSDIDSSDINTFNENIVQKLCLSALKNIKVGNQDADIENIQRIALDILKEMYAKKDKVKNTADDDLLLAKQRDLETPTELLSVHDYENICAVNIAGEAWGLRSWNGYSDIENWLHDGSVFRDTRRDTLTSASSEISSCLSQDLKNSIMNAPSLPKKAPTYSNILMKFDRNSAHDYVNANICHSESDDMFLAKPCMVDIRDPNQLEPILEELDDLGDMDAIVLSKNRLNSESSLVATIDEIRKSTVTNSPRNLYHRRLQVWDSPQFDASSNLKKALWKEPSRIDSNNMLKTRSDKNSVINDIPVCKKSVANKTFNVSTTVFNSDLQNMPTTSQCIDRGSKHNIVQNVKKISKNHEEICDFSNKDIDLLWKLVSENSFPQHSVEDLSSSQITSSLQSLISKEVVPTLASPRNNSSVKKHGKNKPRRKFSILREKFEPKINRTSGEEIQNDNQLNSGDATDTAVVRLKNKLDNKQVSTEANNHKKMLNKSPVGRKVQSNVPDSCKLVASKAKNVLLAHSPPKPAKLPNKT